MIDIELHDEVTEKTNYLSDLAFEAQLINGEQDRLNRIYFEQAGAEYPMLDYYD